MKKWILKWLGVDKLTKEIHRVNRSWSYTHNELLDFGTDCETNHENNKIRIDALYKRVSEIEEKVRVISKTVDDANWAKGWWMEERNNFLNQVSEYVNNALKKK